MLSALTALAFMALPAPTPQAQRIQHPSPFVDVGADVGADLGGAPKPQPAPPVQLVFSSLVEGDLVRAGCGGPSPLGPSRFTRDLGPSLIAAAARGAFAIDTGGLLAIQGVSRFAAERSPDALADLAYALGYRALAVAVQDLTGTRASTVALFHALRARGVSVLASNLRCTDAARDLCDSVATKDGEPAIVTIGGEKVALIAVVRGDALARIGEAQAAGLSFEPPAAAIERSVRRARALGATLIVASYDGQTGLAAASDAMELARSLAEDGRPDLLLAARAGDQLLFARTPQLRPALAGTPPGSAVAVTLRRLEGGDVDLLARPLAKATAAAHPADAHPLDGAPSTGQAAAAVQDDVRLPALDAFAAKVAPAYCELWGRPLPGGKLSRPLDAKGLLELVAGLVRAAAHAEVAILNRGVTKGRQVAFPSGALAAGDLYDALPFDEQLEVAEVSGDWLTKRAKESSAAQLLLLGLSADGASVAGRPIDPRAQYRVATVRFLAHGGDGALPAGPDWRPLPLTLRGVTTAALERPSAADPRDEVPDPAKAVAWMLRPDLDARFASTSISNPGAYAAAPLQRSNTVTLGAEGNLRLAADAPRWVWENAALLRYRSTRTTSLDAAPVTTRDVDDLETLRSTYTWKQLFGEPRWYLPQLYGEGYGETEAGSAGSRRYLGRGSIGGKFSVTPKLSVKLAAAVERQVDDTSARTPFGLNAQLVLLPQELARFGDRRVELDSTIDFFAGGASAQVTVRAHAGLLIDLIGPLSFVLAADVYGERDGGGPTGVSLDTSAGLRVRLLEHFTSF